MNFFVGTSGYSYKEWKGSFYPDKLPANKMLGYYGERFRTVEINNTFYRAPTASVLETWARQVSANFRFVLKAPQEITHVKRLTNSCEMASALVASAGALGERQGPILFQLPPTFRKDVAALSDFLAYLPPCRVAFEFRHQSWFDDEVYELLRDHQAAMCVADAEDDLDVPFVSTADWGYLRLRRPDYDDTALREWAARMRGRGWRECFVFFKHEDAGAGPRMASRLLELVAEGASPQKRVA
ncbi:Uncharacterized protein OS=Geobacter daltonii (strain DSM 22248 / JCM 15807 / FRC-32) GN=Geob_1840 PE=4 SV=1: DUF72 [Gemmata massiliana]|uniref:DUF72 domain-containing protein n=1 Tax=Gemmata massiliana TaxID=1210884 RepID=A0A6P2D805_9BACT|nr:DUF72 domain-containing protein [Gemmata massiliana]VTR97289.1 Uncharacterized protein OS=Geobacter daltonii (strain DSM 22248 / JCM 15807 / FRC-32) GN=Geob_1840 PE=4 SV=1: DUF72 [Gemmata massiliana]